MKSSLTKFALTATLGLAITLTLNACEEKGGGGGKLLEAISDETGVIHKFEYDKQNRIVKIDDKAITYADNLITVGTEKYAINGNTITVDGNSFTVNGDGYIVNGFGVEYKYKDGNVISGVWTESGYDFDYSYDNKKSPFSNCTTPKWIIQHFLELFGIYASKNNFVSSSGEGGTGTSKYEYDSDGFPVKMTMTFKGNEGDVSNTTTRFTYRGEPQTATPQTQTPTAKTEPPTPPQTATTFTDPRDSKTYKTVKIGNQTWMAENLNYEAKDSKCYDNDPNCQKSFRIYDWKTAMKACPSGWHLPSKAEGEELLISGGEKDLIEKMKPRKNESWWTSSSDDDAFATVFFIHERCGEDECTNTASTSKENENTVRCLQN